MGTGAVTSSGTGPISDINTSIKQFYNGQKLGKSIRHGL
jgi:hypothetical protein